jgi:phospholipid/cholesterol/gamma-HCH transport system ATP-binding protein
MSDDAVISVNSISTRFGEKTVHESVSFEVKKGDVFALIGGSGSGKSVLLKEILGLIKPSSGDIKIFGTNIIGSETEELSALRKRIGVLFQNGALFSALTTGDNVAVPLREQTNLKEDFIQEIVSLRLLFTGLTPEDADKMPSELSGGMRKRAALARALALEPEILFLDEPTSGLDSVNARAMDKLIRTLADNIGLTVVIVTHDIDTLWGIVDKVVAIGEGKVIAAGSVKEVSESNDNWIKEYFSSVVVPRGAEAHGT